MPVLATAIGISAIASSDKPQSQAVEVASIHPFKSRAPEEMLRDLRRRIHMTRWPDKETAADQSQGAQLSKLKPLLEYWGSDYDWRRAEAKLNAFPQFTTAIDGVEIHFIHVRSKHPNALPVIISHGWPGSVFEQIKLIEPLTNPTAYGGKAEDAFDVVIPSLPGFGFSSKPSDLGWGSDRIGLAWDVLMKRLGYKHYVAQGGDWGAGIVQAMGRQAPSGLLGIHTNLPATIPNEIGAALGGAPLPSSVTDDERASFEALSKFLKNGDLAYVKMMNARPQAVAYGLTDSPVGLAGWMLVHPGFEHWAFGDDVKQSPTRDDVLDNFTLYWLTNSAASSARIYWEHRGQELTSATAQKTDQISVPVAISVFPDEVYRPTESWSKRAFRNLIYFGKAEKGGHFAAWEYPEIFSEELRKAFRTLRK